MNHIGKLWEEFASEAIADKAPKIQYDEMRFAFYAGSIALLGDLIERIREKKMSQEEGEVYFKELHAEMLAYTTLWEMDMV